MNPVPIIVDEGQLPLVERALARALRPLTARTPLVLNETPKGIELSLSQPLGNGQVALPPTCTLFIVAEELDDVLRCHTYSLNDDGEAIIGTDDIYVAKPPLLRKTPFHDKTINGKTYDYTSVNERTVTRVSDSVVEDQKITPDYETEDGTYPGDFIFATTDVGGGTAATYNSRRVIWVDVNFDGRAWARV